MQEEIEKLEQAGVITRSMSPWASPIVIVPKKTVPREPPRRRMCVDYRMVNSLAPPVVKVHSKAKGVLTFVPLPKIDEIFAKLKGSQIYSTFDMRSGYYHLELSQRGSSKNSFCDQGTNRGKMGIQSLSLWFNPGTSLFSKTGTPSPGRINLCFWIFR